MIKNNPSLEELNKMNIGNMGEHLNIQYTNIGDDYLEGTMPVDHRTIQPFGLLHGGASVVLAESLASLAASLCVDLSKFACVGLDINSTHLRSVRNGLVTGRATAVHIGRSIQVWEIKIKDDRDRLINISRLTVAIIKKQD
jgi:1,4-dihydroxy-2-naphthoyl-CoA hydrolase